jgi:Arc/MetJ family transcription regulator
MTRNLRKGVGKTDVRDIAERVEEITIDQNDRAVCAVLRSALRTGIGPTSAAQACAALGLDLRAALRRARIANRLAGK